MEKLQNFAKHNAPPAQECPVSLVFMMTIIYTNTQVMTVQNQMFHSDIVVDGHRRLCFFMLRKKHDGSQSRSRVSETERDVEDSQTETSQNNFQPPTLTWLSPDVG